jgi:hypothetical protein
MTATQFLVILGTIYLVPDMSPRYRGIVGMILMIIALIIQVI